MTNIVGPVWVENEIIRLSGLLEQQVLDLAYAASEAAEAEADYRFAHAQAFMASEGTGPAREAQAQIHVTETYRRRRMAEAKQLGLQEAGRSLRSRLDALRTIAANVRGAITHSEGVGR